MASNKFLKFSLQSEFCSVPTELITQEDVTMEHKFITSTK